MFGLVACGDERAPADGGPAVDGGGEVDGSVDGSTTDLDAGQDGGGVLPDGAVCATGGSSSTELEREPVDIIWVIDNSGSMEPSIRQVNDGLDEFAARIAASNLDYRVIMLSERGMGGTQICIPEPLAGDSECGDDTDCSDGGCFFHRDVDIYSTQVVEQILGTLAQTSGYSEGESRGSAPWLELLRPGARKSFVIVSDDNSRTCDRDHTGSPNDCDTGPDMDVFSLEDYPGGTNPFTGGRELGPGILTDSYGDLFEGYVFNAIYGWGDEGDADEKCSDGAFPAAAGHTYTALVERTAGVRAQICDQATVWDDFFDAIAERVNESSGISCQFTVPEPPEGLSLIRNQVNVYLADESGADAILIRGVADEEACGLDSGWYYGEDDEGQPTVQLCPTTCTAAEAAYREDPSTRVDVLFGCDTILI